MAEFIIYKITNLVNGKNYIGFTSKTLEHRWATHVYAATKRNSHYRLHAAIRKYGVERFKCVAIATSYDGNYALNVLEPQFIKEYNTQENGYNTKPGGSKGGWKCSHETRQKMSQNNRWRGKLRSGELNPMFGRHHTNETKTKISVANKGNTYRVGKIHSEDTKKKLQNMVINRYANGFINALKGKPMKEETKRRMSEDRIGKISWTKNYSVTFPDGHTENITNMAKFCRIHVLSNGNMSSVAKGRLPHHKGFICSILNGNTCVAVGC